MVTARPKLSCWQRLGRIARIAAVAAIAIVAGLLAARDWVDARVNAEIRDQVQQKLAEGFPNLRVSIQAAQRLKDSGFEVRGVKVTLNDGTPLLSAEELFFACRASLAEFVIGKPRIEHLTFRRLRLYATRMPDGSWSTDQLFPIPRLGSGPPPSASLEDSEVEIFDTVKNPATRLVLRDIDIMVSPAGVAQVVPAKEATSALPGAEPRSQDAGPEGSSTGSTGRFRINGSMRGDHFSLIEVDAVLDAESGDWQASGDLSGLELSPRLFESLPDNISAKLKDLSAVRAQGEFQFQMAYHPTESSELQYAIEGRVSEGRVDDRRLPMPLTHLRANIQWTNRMFRVTESSARLGAAELQFDCLLNGVGDRLRGSANFDLRRLTVDRALVASLPESLQETWSRFEPLGELDCVAQVRFDEQGVHPSLTLHCRQLSVRYDRFPYVLRDATATVRYQDHVLSCDDMVALTTGNEPLHLKWRIKHPGPEATGWMEAHSEGPIPIDVRLLSALETYPDLLGVIQSLDPRGAIKLSWARVERLTPRGEVDKKFEIDLVDCSARYEKFPILITGIQGRVSIHNRRWQVQKLTGTNGSSFVQCDGGWLPGAERGQGSLALDFVATDVGLDEEMRAAVAVLSPGCLTAWDSLRPRGTVDHLAANIRFQGATRKCDVELVAQKWAATQNVEGRSISILPTWFPYRIDEVTGKVRVSQGVVRLEQIHGKHNQSPLRLEGQVAWGDDGRWRAELTRLTADRLSPDHDLLGALPPSLAQALKQVQLTGTMHLDGRFLAERDGYDAPLTTRWDCWVGMENASLTMGVPWEHLRGGIRWTGEQSPTRFFARGELEIDSVFHRGIQLRDLRGPILIDRNQALLGTWAEAGRRDRVPRQVTAAVVGGNLGLDAKVTLSPDLPFALHATLQEGDLQQIASQLSTSASKNQLTGRTFGIVNLQGTRQGTHTWRGDGRVRLRDADIYELPVMVQVLSLLSLRPPDETAFTTSDIDFEIRGENVVFNRIDFKGDVISLKGSGVMDLERNVNLNFYAIVGREELQLKILRNLLAEASRNILLIQVEGNLEDLANAKVIRKPLPEIERIRNLFQEGLPTDGLARPPVRPNSLTPRVR